MVISHSYVSLPEGKCSELAALFCPIASWNSASIRWSSRSASSSWRLRTTKRAEPMTKTFRITGRLSTEASKLSTQTVGAKGWNLTHMWCWTKLALFKAWAGTYLSVSVLFYSHFLQILTFYSDLTLQYVMIHHFYAFLWFEEVLRKNIEGPMGHHGPMADGPWRFPVKKEIRRQLASQVPQGTRRGAEKVARTADPQKPPGRHGRDGWAGSQKKLSMIILDVQPSNFQGSLILKYVV